MLWSPCPSRFQLADHLDPAVGVLRHPLLDTEGVPYTVRHYLEQPPTDEEPVALLVRLGLESWDITRLGEPIAEDLGLTSWPRDDSSRPRWIEALTTHPTLIQRPIITADDGTATVARSPEAIHLVMLASGRTNL